MVAEDNPINQRVATLQLTKLGHQVEICEHGQAVLDANLDQFDIVLMDCQMPVLDGLEATRRIRKLELEDKTREPVYIIAMTANTQEDDRAACIEAGMDDFVSKPVQLKELQIALQKSLGIEIKEEETSESEIPLLDTTQLDQLRAADQADTFREIISMYLEQTHSQLTELHTALADQNHEQTANIAHQIKGSSANLGASQLADACSDLRSIKQVNSKGPHAPTGNPRHFDRTRFISIAGRITTFDKRPAPSIVYAQWMHCTRPGALITPAQESIRRCFSVHLYPIRGRCGTT